MYELRLLVTDEDAARLGAQNEAPDLSLPSPADRALQALADGLVIRELQSKGILLLRHPDGRYEEIVLRTVEKGLSRRGRLIRLAKQPVPERVRAQGEAEEYGVEDDGVEAEAQPGGSLSHRGAVGSVLPRRGLRYERVQAALPQIELALVAPYMLQLMLRNVATYGFTFVDPTTVSSQLPRTSKPGCILASPSYPANLTSVDQFYVYHWTRDAAIAAIEMANNPIFLDPAGLSDYVNFSKICQDSAVADNHFYRAAYQIDGTVRAWSDQKDGPALQNLAFVEALPRLDPADRATAKQIAQRNLDRLIADWADDTNNFNLWEEVIGASFFARAVQLRCLKEVQTTNALGLTVPANRANLMANLANVIAVLSNELDGHWDPSTRYYVSVRYGGLRPGSLLTDLSGYDPNSDVVMACIYGAIPCTDPKLLSTAAKVRAQYDTGTGAYPINSADRILNIGPLIGRYPGDIYDGNVGKDPSQPTKGHPWAVCTANFAELYYRLAKTFGDEGVVAYDELTGPFFDQVGLDAATVNSAAETGTVAQRLRDAGDKMLQALIYHSDHYELSQQFDAGTGYEKSVTNSTWSYAAYLSAVRAR